MKRFSIGDAEVGGSRLLVIAGPCLAESAELCLEVARHMKGLCRERDLPYVFKASYRKANRSSGEAFTGPPLDDGLAMLGRVRRELSVPVLTDVHEVAEVERAAEVADCLQIPAFLSRQTDLLVAATRTGRAVNVKKGQFLSPDDMKHVVEKVTGAGGERLLLTERGTSFGYGDLVVDFRGLVTMRSLGWPVVFDATHSLQRRAAASETDASGSRGETGGDRRFAVPLMRAAVACGIDGLFFEVHPDPRQALSDRATQLPLEQAAAFLDEAVRVRQTTTERTHA